MHQPLRLAMLTMLLYLPLISADATESPPTPTAKPAANEQGPAPSADSNTAQATAVTNRLIQACHAKAQATVSTGVDADMLKTEGIYLACLRSAINIESKKIFDAKTLGLFQKNFVLFDKTAKVIYEIIYRGNTLCRQNDGTGCGIETTTHLDYLNEQGTVLEQVLKNVVGMDHGIY